MRYWARKDKAGKITTVESYSHDLEVEGAIEITKEEYDAYIASLPVVEPEPVRDLAKEIDEIKARMAALEKR